MTWYFILKKKMKQKGSCCPLNSANRVSLRCVFLFSLEDVINDILYITMAFIRDDNRFCTPAGVIVQFSDVLSATLLTLVRLNLLLVFVNIVPRKDLLERFYYPIALIYILFVVLFYLLIIRLSWILHNLRSNRIVGILKILNIKNTM